jgi:homocysteine S-methyltransferase
VGAVYRNALPQLGDEVFLTDSGLETDLIFNEGFDLPEFASFVLVDDARGTAALEAYFRRHVDIAVQHSCGVILEAPTWRASRGWGARIGYPAAELRRVNESAVELLAGIRGQDWDAASTPVVVSGCIGPRADAYSPAARMSEDEAKDYHTEQIEILAVTEVDLVHAMTITYTAEAIGIARAAAGSGVPAAISFTTETDGHLPGGTSLADAVAAVDAATGGSPVYYGVNCAHPSHFESALPGARPGRVSGASARTPPGKAMLNSMSRQLWTPGTRGSWPVTTCGYVHSTRQSPSSVAAAAPTRGTCRPWQTHSCQPSTHDRRSRLLCPPAALCCHGYALEDARNRQDDGKVGDRD